MISDPRISAIIASLVSALHLIGIIVSNQWTISTTSQGVTIHFPWTNANSTGHNTVDVNSTSTGCLEQNKKKKKKSPSRIMKDAVRRISYLKHKLRQSVSNSPNSNKCDKVTVSTCEKSSHKEVSTCDRYSNTFIDTCDKSTNTCTKSQDISIPESKPIVKKNQLSTHFLDKKQTSESSPDSAYSSHFDHMSSPQRMSRVRYYTCDMHEWSAERSLAEAEYIQPGAYPRHQINTDLSRYEWKVHYDQLMGAAWKCPYHPEQGDKLCPKLSSNACSLRAHMIDYTLWYERTYKSMFNS